MSRIDRFRANRDKFFRENDNSPLLPEQRQHFSGLSYYPENSELQFEVEIDSEGVSQEPLHVETTTGESAHLVPAGLVHLEIEGRTVSLTLFREHGRGGYFLPFRDATAGSETYYLGRYLDPQATPRGTITLDFNYAYNPFCAYNEHWSCPIPPEENHIDVAIRAGEKTFSIEREAGS